MDPTRKTARVAGAFLEVLLAAAGPMAPPS
jgi:hypothetical protein